MTPPGADPKQPLTTHHLKVTPHHKRPTPQNKKIHPNQSTPTPHTTPLDPTHLPIPAASTNPDRPLPTTHPHRHLLLNLCSLRSLRPHLTHPKATTNHAHTLHPHAYRRSLPIANAPSRSPNPTNTQPPTYLNTPNPFLATQRLRSLAFTPPPCTHLPARPRCYPPRRHPLGVTLEGFVR